MTAAIFHVVISSASLLVKEEFTIRSQDPSTKVSRFGIIFSRVDSPGWLWRSIHLHSVPIISKSTPASSLAVSGSARGRSLSRPIRTSEKPQVSGTALGKKNPNAVVVPLHMKSAAGKTHDPAPPHKHALQENKNRHCGTLPSLSFSWPWRLFQ